MVKNFKNWGGKRMKNIFEIEKLFKARKFDIILKDCEKYFEKIDNYAKLLRTHKITEPEEIKKVLTVLSGYQMTLEPILGLASAYEKTREENTYDELRIEATKNEQKFVDAVADRQASISAQEDRKVKNIFQSYRDSCKTGISSAQSILGYEKVKIQAKVGIDEGDE